MAPRPPGGRTRELQVSRFGFHAGKIFQWGLPAQQYMCVHHELHRADGLVQAGPGGPPTGKLGASLLGKQSV